MKRIAIIGGGGLGLAALQGLLDFKLAVSNRITLFDYDSVEESNIHRQIFYTINDLGKSKIETLRDKFAGTIGVEFIEMKINEETVKALKNFDLILLCVDNADTRLVVNDFCVKNEKPFIEAGVEGFVGTVFIYVPHQTACYRCLVSTKPPHKKKPGIITFTNVFAGLYQAKETWRFLNGESHLIGKLLFFDLKNNIYEFINVPKNPKCPICSEG